MDFGHRITAREGLADTAADALLVVVTSDHGNLEDLSTGGHTYAKVPLVAKGPTSEELVAHARDLRDVAPGLLAALGSSWDARRS